MMNLPPAAELWGLDDESPRVDTKEQIEFEP